MQKWALRQAAFHFCGNRRAAIGNLRLRGYAPRLQADICVYSGQHEPAARNLYPHPLHARLALSVNAMLQPKGAEFVLWNFASYETGGIVAEDFDLLDYGSIMLSFQRFAPSNAFLQCGSYKHLFLNRDQSIALL